LHRHYQHAGHASAVGGGQQRAVFIQCLPICDEAFVDQSLRQRYDALLLVGLETLAGHPRRGLVVGPALLDSENPNSISRFDGGRPRAQELADPVYAMTNGAHRNSGWVCCRADVNNNTASGIVKSRISTPFSTLYSKLSLTMFWSPGTPLPVAYF
jgi:hypothetical protein